MTCDLFGEDNWRRRLAMRTRREELFGESLCAGAGKSTDESGDCAFQNRAFTSSHNVVRCANRQK